MRLSCPNCAAIYELSEDRLTPGGSHVQRPGEPGSATVVHADGPSPTNA